MCQQQSFVILTCAQNGFGTFLPDSVSICCHGAQAKVPHGYVLVFFHSFQRWERGVIRGIPRGIYPHQAERAPKSIEVRVEMVPGEECVDRSHC